MSKRILLVDDDESILFVFSQILDYNGFSVGTATCGVDALRLIEQDCFDLAILDYMLGDMTGEQIAERISIMKKDVRIMMITGYSTVAERLSRAPNSVFKKVLTKPVSEEQLIVEVRQLI